MYALFFTLYRTYFKVGAKQNPGLTPVFQNVVVILFIGDKCCLAFT